MKRTSFRRTTAWLTIVLVVAAGYLALAHQFTLATRPSSIKAFPDDCDVVLTVDLLEACDSLDSIGWIVEEVLGVPFDSDTVLAFMQEMLANMGGATEDDLAIDLKADVLPWIGSDASIGVDFDPETLSAFLPQVTQSGSSSALHTPLSGTLAPPALNPNDLLNYVMVAVSCRDTGRIQPFLDKIEGALANYEMPPVSVTIEGSEWLIADQGAVAVAVGVVGDHLVALVAPLTKLLPTVERVAGVIESGEGSIALDADYQELDHAAGYGGVLSLYVNLPVEALAPTDLSAPVAASASSIVRLFADGGGIRLRAVEAMPEGQLAEGLGIEGFDIRGLALRDRSVAVPRDVVGFVQFGSIYEYWTVLRGALDQITIPVRASGYTPGHSGHYDSYYPYDSHDPYGFYDYSSDESFDGYSDDATDEVLLGDLVPFEVLALVDSLLSHFVGDTHIALTGSIDNPMALVAVRVEDGEALVSYFELLATQIVPGLHIRFSHHSDEMIKTAGVAVEEGLQSGVSYCLVDDMLIVSNMEPAVRLAVDTVKGIVASVEESPDIINLRSQMGDGGLVLYNLDGSRLVEFLSPLEIRMPHRDIEWIWTVDRILDRMSSYVSLDGELCIGHFEIIFKPRRLE